MTDKAVGAVSLMRQLLNGCTLDVESEVIRKAYEILDGLPGFENALTHGGCIQDRKGNVCKAGDAVEVIYQGRVVDGLLMWDDDSEGKFFYLLIDGEFVYLGEVALWKKKTA